MVNRVAALVGKGKIEMTVGPVPEPKADEVLIKVRHCGVCGSDMHNFLEGRTGKRVISYPFVLGHEFAGDVVALGADVTNVQVGDRVCVEPGAACGHCEYCRIGRYNLCEHMRFLSAYPNVGSMQDYVVFPARNCFKLPDNLDTIDGAMIEPLAVGLHAANRGNVKWGDTVLIIGSGCIGIMTVLACKAKNATNIIAVDVFDNRLAKAKELGATATINSRTEDVAARVAELTGGRLADVVFECAGRPETFNMACDAVRPGGAIVTEGNISEPLQMNHVLINMKEIDIKCMFRYVNVYPVALRLISSGEINIKGLQPKIFPFDKTPEAFDCAINDGKSVLKCVLEM